jgi:hypothetical protein
MEILCFHALTNMAKDNHQSLRLDLCVKLFTHFTINVASHRRAIFSPSGLNAIMSESNSMFYTVADTVVADAAGDTVYR